MLCSILILCLCMREMELLFLVVCLECSMTRVLLLFSIFAVTTPSRYVVSPCAEVLFECGVSSCQTIF